MKEIFVHLRAHSEYSLVRFYQQAPAAGFQGRSRNSAEVGSHPVSRLSCPALMVSAPASGSGKTMVVAALARLHRRQGRRVRVFKCGPDFLDPQIHAAASGLPCENIDLAMCGEADARWRLARAASNAWPVLACSAPNCPKGGSMATASTTPSVPPRLLQSLRRTSYTVGVANLSIVMNA
jgi:hypothetical protein